MASKSKVQVETATKRKSELPAGTQLVRALRLKSAAGRLAWSPDGKLLVSGEKTELWDVETGNAVRQFRAAGESGVVAFHPRDQVFASVAEGCICLWDSRTGDLLREIEHDGAGEDLAFDPDGAFLAGGGNGRIRIWNAKTGELVRTLEGVQSLGVCVAFQPKGHGIAGPTISSALLWDSRTGSLLHRFEGYQKTVFDLAFDARGRTLATAGFDQTVKLWDSADGRLVRTLEGHTAAAVKVRFSPDGRLIATAGDSRILLWNPETGNCAGVIAKFKESFTYSGGLAFHPTKSLLAVSNGLSVSVFDLDLDILLAKPAIPMITYTSAKIVLVGESNVGKSYLAHRIATGQAPTKGAIESTHGMKFWPIDPKVLGSISNPPTGLRCDVVLWDLGGQDEYRLVHQLFLHDTTLALVLLDPTRGRTAFEEVEAWDKRLEKQIQGRNAVKFLVGSKQDRASAMVDRQGLERLKTDCGFAGYYETSALNGRGIEDLCGAIASAIDWDVLGKTTRPELFQQIRDEIEKRRKLGQVVLHVADLHRALGSTPPSEEDVTAVSTVTEQLAAQGVIARSRVSTGEPVLVLQIPEIERYAGSLILAARNNPRGVPALELRALAQPDFRFPGLGEKERLARHQERPVIESTVQLLLEHGVCFQHEGLLIFPTLFTSGTKQADSIVPHGVSLYYDFAGAIDNVYASLVAWLVMARNFGQVRLWADTAEFQLGDHGLCGLRKVGRPGGFAHVDVYFDDTTPTERRELFVSFVEEHLRLHGVEIREHVAVTCPCGHRFEEETLRQRIARGEKDVLCPVCENRHNLAEGSHGSRQRDADLAQRTWALKTEIQERRQESTERAVQVIERISETKVAGGPIHILHLSDLHFTASTVVAPRLQWLLDDLKQGNGLAVQQLDYLVISGDFTDKGSLEGFDKAYDFVSDLTKEFALSAERCIFVPGNHDVKDLREAYDWRETSDGLKNDEWVEQGQIILARNPEKYPLRFKAFSERFFHKFLQRPYPSDFTAQGMSIPFWETGIQFLALNSCWQIDQFNRKRSSVHSAAVAQVVKDAQKQEVGARASGLLGAGNPLLRIAIWHHSVNGPEQMKDIDFLGHLQKNDVKLALHGDVHEMRRELIGYWTEKKKLHIVGSGGFGARSEDRPESVPRLYNLLQIDRWTQVGTNPYALPSEGRQRMEGVE